MKKQYLVLSELSIAEVKDVNDCVALIEAETKEEALEIYVRRHEIHTELFKDYLDYSIWEEINKMEGNDIPYEGESSDEQYYRLLSVFLGSQMLADQYMKVVDSGGVSYEDGKLSEYITDELLYAVHCRGQYYYKVFELSEVMLKYV